VMSVMKYMRETMPSASMLVKDGLVDNSTSYQQIYLASSFARGLC